MLRTPSHGLSVCAPASDRLKDTAAPAPGNVVRLIPRAHPETAGAAAALSAALASLEPDAQVVLSDQLRAFLERQEADRTPI